MIRTFALVVTVLLGLVLPPSTASAAMAEYRDTLAPVNRLLFGTNFGGTDPTHDLRDPWERTNRVFYGLHDWIGRQVYGPAEDSYGTLVPSALKRGVHNFFINLRDLIGTGVALARFEGDDAWVLGRRVVINSTLGLGGLVDVATMLQLPRGSAGRQPLCYRHLPSGPYLLLPTVGPTTALEAGAATVAMTLGAVIAGPAGNQARAIVELLLFFAITTPTETELILHQTARQAADPYAAERALFYRSREAKCAPP